MSKTSEGEIVRRKAEEIPPTSPAELARMRAIPDEAIDTSDIPERVGTRRLRRDEEGRLPKRRSVVRDAVAAAMTERGMTVYALWKAAKADCPTISESAIGEFLKGTRSIGLEYLEAIMGALGLKIQGPAPMEGGGAGWPPGHGGNADIPSFQDH